MRSLTLQEVRYMLTHDRQQTILLIRNDITKQDQLAVYVNVRAFTL